MENFIGGLANMTNVKNDEKILLLKSQIQEKRDKVDKIKRFTPVTNCMLNLNSVNYNINILSKDELIGMLVVLNAYKMSAIELGLLDCYVISNYPVTDWIIDIKAKLEFLSRRDEENKLKAMERKLIELLSNEKKVELQLDEIESMLK